MHATVHLDSALLRKLSTLPRIRTPCRGFLPDLSSPDANTVLVGGRGSLVDGLSNGHLLYQQPHYETLYYQWVPFFLLFQVGPEIFYKYIDISMNFPGIDVKNKSWKHNFRSYFAKHI